jgi:hypothetical protein
MPKPAMPPDLDPATRRAVAVGLYNRTMALLAGREGPSDRDDELLHAAHASRYHWGEVGTPLNLARGEWLCSRVYATLGRAEPAGWHARRCLELLEGPAAAEREDWDLAAAYEAHARASRVAGDDAATTTWRRRAEAALADIADADDREVIEQDLASIP